ncbi:MAG: methyltransferase domain-containing protein [Actinomycetota bacterium]|nr:methyltransferase domain-containing protein [Actinomycetota bacterium]
MSAAGTLAWPAAWHDVECASYTADLEVWRALADERGGPVLDLGCGTGRVALDLAARGHAVVGIDADPDLARALDERAREGSLAARAHAADARSFSLGSRHPLAIAPMQVVQLLGGDIGRKAMLSTVAGHLSPGGLLAVALADPFDAVPAGEALPPLPDMREVGGWVLSSTPVDVRDEGDGVAIDRHRQAVSPAGDMTEELSTIRLDSVSAAGIQQEGSQAGYRVLGVREVPATRDYVGSTVVLLERPA